MARTSIFVITFFFLISCHEVPSLSPEESSKEQTITVCVSQPETRSFNTTTAEAWEKKINTAAIYVFNSAGKVVRVYTLSAAQITAINSGTNMNISFLVPGSVSSCNIYFVANTTPSGSIATEASFLTSYEQDIASYNGAYASVTTQALRTNGFVMTGQQTGVTLNPSQTTNVGITLRRIVAKVAVDVSFTAVINLGGITINNITLTNSSPYSNLFPLSPANIGGTPVTLSQTPQPNGTNKYRAFFYIYENDIRPSATAPTLTISGSGMLLLIPVPFGYLIPLTGDSGTGKITRNSVYYVNISVTKLTNILLLSRAQPGITVEQYWGGQEP